MTLSLLSKQNGDVEVIRPQNGTDFSLEELQKYVDGLIDIIDLKDGNIMVVNDEGKFTKLMNPFATFIALTHHAIAPRDFVAGDVVLCPSEMVK